jgi:uncharacterized protein YutE (UPF0331/DUF86 family)
VNERLLKLAQRITDELSEFERVNKRAQEGWRRAEQSSDDLYLDSVAMNLHSFYAGLERLFELIAMTIDGTLPQGANWHQVLLQQMTTEVSGVRPAVISERTYEALDEYRGFRHVARHAYTFKFDPVKLKRLVEEVPAMFAQLRTELLAFADFLKQQA